MLEPPLLVLIDLLLGIEETCLENHQHLSVVHRFAVVGDGGDVLETLEEHLNLLSSWIVITRSRRRNLVLDLYLPALLDIFL